jgi:hypothetical protein
MVPNARSDFLDFIDRNGKDIFQDRQKFKSLLEDFFRGRHRAEKNILISSLSVGVPDRLLDHGGSLAYQTLQSQCIALLLEEGYNSGISQWAVDTWAIALGITDPATADEISLHCSLPASPSDIQNDIARSQFLDLITRFGTDVYRDPQKCRSLISDFFRGKFKAEKNVLVDCIISGAVKYLLEKRDVLSFAEIRVHCTDLIRNEGYGQALAAWAIDTWAMGLGVISRPVIDVTTGYLTITSVPPGGNVYLDDVLRGTTPTSITGISIGAHKIRCTLNTFLDWENLVEIRPGELTEVPIILIPILVAPIQPPAPFPAPGKPSKKGIAVAAILVICLCLVVAFYMTGTTGKKTPTPTVTNPVVTSAPVRTYVTVTQSTLASARSSGNVQTYTGKKVDLTSSGQFSMEPAQQKGPYTVSVTAYPVMIHDEKVVFRGSTDEQGEVYKIDRPTENAEYTISVTRKSNGEVLLNERRSNFASSTEPNSWTLYTDGPYVISITGRLVTLDLHA